MLEPRRKQKRHKQAFKTKWQQKRTFREFDEKFEKELKKEEAMESWFYIFLLIYRIITD